MSQFHNLVSKNGSKLFDFEQFGSNNFILFATFCIVRLIYFLICYIFDISNSSYFASSKSLLKLMVGFCSTIVLLLNSINEDLDLDKDFAYLELIFEQNIDQTQNIWSLSTL